MGKWKYVNYIMVVVILVHMYWYFHSRYEASWPIYVVATAAWILTLAVGIYIYFFRLQRSVNMSTAGTKIKTTPLKQRPKVVLNRRKED